MQYKQVQIVCGKGGGLDRFARTLRSLTVDALNHLYAVGDSELKVFNADGKLRRRWPTSKPAFSVAVSVDGSVYAGQEGQVEIFDDEGRLANTWKDAERLGRVTAIGFVDDSVLVGDAEDRTIRRFDTSGKFLHNIGKNNRMQGFLIPNGIVDFSVDAGGIIHAANPGKHRVERYTLEDHFLGHIGRFDGLDPSGFSGCCNPTNVTVTGHDRIYVTEKAGPRAKVYDFQGKLMSVIATDVFHPNCKNMDIAVDRRGRVYVADTVNLDILAFEEDRQL
jgi:sugar lactone lactonase YvrE